jgi:enamine deaminase RidA (YjgF/YER057c/UK114 family)
MNKAYREFFPTKPPARATIKVELLDPKFLVEIDAIAVVD